MTFAAEPYAVFVDDLVSSLTGGITRERFTFLDELKPFQLAFASTAVASTVRIQGLVNGAYFRFTGGTDFDVSAGTIIWRQSAPDVPAARATWPDAGTDFYASYERIPDPAAPPLLTDRNPGSVVRTLAESFAREYAVLSRQLELVYQAGFLATATGRDLDQVVSLVGLSRWTSTVVSGELVFARQSPAPADIFIPAGTLVTSGKPPMVTVETTEEQALRSGTQSATVPVRARVPGPPGMAPAGTLTVINRPILGIDSVTNTQPLKFGGTETDTALRARAGRALEGSGGATTDAILSALTSVQGIREQDVRMVEDPVASPGLLKITIASQLDDTRAGLAAALIEQQRPAGIRVHHNLNIPLGASPLQPTSSGQGQDPGPPSSSTASTDPVWFDIAVSAAVTASSASLSQTQKTALTAAVSSAASAYVGGLAVGETIVYNRVVAAIIALNGVYDVSLDLFPAGAGAATGRRNLVPSPPDTRPRLQAANLDVRLRGALVALEVSVQVERKGLAALADPNTALTQIRTDIVQRLQAQLNIGAAISSAALQGALPDTSTYSVQKLSYSADFLEEGLQVTRGNPEFAPTPDQQAWIRDVHVSDASRAT